MSTNVHSTATLSGSVVRPTRWPLERVLFAISGTMTPVSALLTALLSPWFLLLTAAVGVDQWLYVTTRACPASMVLKRLGRPAQCRW